VGQEKPFDRRTENLIADFRDLPRANKRGKVRKAREIGNLIDGIIDKLDLAKPRLENELKDQWDYVVGQDNIERCQPLKIQGDILHIGCTHPTLARDLHMNKRMILKRVKSICPSIRDVRFVAS